MTQQLARGQTRCFAALARARPARRCALLWSIAARGWCPGNCRKAIERRHLTHYCSLSAHIAGLPAAAPEKFTHTARLVRQPRPRRPGDRQAARLLSKQGLEVELIAPADPNAPPKLVAAGQADYAVSYQPALQMLVAEGLPLVRVGVLVAQPLNALVALKRGRSKRSPTSRAERSAIPSRASRRRPGRDAEKRGA